MPDTDVENGVSGLKLALIAFAVTVATFIFLVFLAALAGAVVGGAEVVLLIAISCAVAGVVGVRYIRRSQAH